MPAVNPEAQEIARDCLASRARHLDRVLARIYDGALRGRGVTGAQLGMLVAICLGAAAGNSSAAAVGRRLELDKSTVSRNLARLTAAGLVDGSDGLRVTPQGTAMIRACYQAWRRAQSQAQVALGVERHRLLSSLSGFGAASAAGERSQTTRHNSH
jgi:DNA-binding MarR family transcriptional regulator